MPITQWREDGAHVDRIRAVLASAVGDPSESTLSALLNETYREPGTRLDIIWDGPEIIGAVGTRVCGLDLAKILHMAIDARYRGQGWGRLAIHYLRQEVYPGVSLLAETDHEAVGFYARLGFRIESLGEKYPGIERFRCLWAGIRG